MVIVILLCFTRALPVRATEQKEYVFDIIPPISMFKDYEFTPEPDLSGVYEGRMPEGEYNIQLILDFGDLYDIFSSVDPVIISYVYSEEEGVNIASFNCSLTDGDVSLSISGEVADFYDEFGVSYLLLFLDGSDEPISLDNTSSITFIPVNDVSLPEIYDIVHADLFGSFLICGTLVGLALFRGNRYV